MILALDIGNTNIVVGGIENGKVLFTGRMKTDEKNHASAEKMIYRKDEYT